MSRKKDQYRAVLAKYLHPPFIEVVVNLLVKHPVKFKIAKPRKTKLGDYRPPIYHTNHRISVNHNLNKYSFLITFVHEFAHLLVWEKHKNKVDPHGQEWKDEYRRLMMVFIEKGVFPDDIKKVLLKSIKNSKAASTSDLKLSRVLKNYDNNAEQLTLEDLDEFFEEVGDIDPVKVVEIN